MPALTIRAGTTLESLNAHGVGHLPGWFGFEAVGLAPGRLSARMLIRSLRDRYWAGRARRI